VESTDWQEWHAPYDEPGSPLERRLRVVQRHVAAWLDATAPRPVRVLSLCAGQGRDLIEVLAGRADARRVRACLVELDAGNAAAASAAMRAAGLDGVDVRQADAGLPASYQDASPAGLVLACGIFGNVADADVHRTVEALPALCAPRGTVIWTRHRRPPDRTSAIRRWFAAAGFEEQAFDAPADVHWAVGVHRLAAAHPPSPVPRRLFTFAS
jgi:hypothetical protein